MRSSILIFKLGKNQRRERSSRYNDTEKWKSQRSQLERGEESVAGFGSEFFRWLVRLQTICR